MRADAANVRHRVSLHAKHHAALQISRVKTTDLPKVSNPTADVRSEIFYEDFEI